MITFTNQAFLSYNNRVTNSNITTGQIVSVLSGEKTALLDSYTVGSAVTYVVSIVNSGSASFNGLTLTDSLGGYEFGENIVYPLAYTPDSLKYFVNGVLQDTPEITAGPPLTVSGISVPAGGNAIIVYETTVTDYAPLGENSTITNEAVISGNGLTAPLVLTETVGSTDEPLLTITKSLSPIVVPENGELTYTFVIQNFGNSPATAEDNAVITDIFDPILNNITVVFNGEEWSSPENYTYDTNTGAFATVAGQVTVPAATFVQNPVTGAYTTEPGVSTLTVSGTI